MSDKHENCNENEDFEIMTLTLEDNSEIECAIIGVFDVEEKEYIALIPVNDIESEGGEVYLYGFKEKEDGQPELISIVSDDEYEKVAAEFDKLMDEEYGEE